jgi:DNA invertase Pin-like site-specific DNA recombinase
MRRRQYRPNNAWSLVTKPEPGNGRVIGQVRYSSELQDGGYSIDEQKRQIQLAVEKEGWELVGWCEEPAVSAKGELDSRPQLAELLMVHVGSTCNVVMCHESSRWTRNPALGEKSLEILRGKQCWWQTADGQWDINKVLQEGFDVAWAITQVQNAAFLRKLSGHVRKGKLGKARQGYSNGFPMFGYRMPEIVISADNGQLSQVRRRVVYEPHPEYFAVLQKVGELFAQEPPLTVLQVAEELNRLGLPYLSRQSGPRIWSESILSSLLYRQYPREYAPGSGHGTITLATGELVEGKHVAAWSYELCQKIDANRALLGMNRQARPRKGIVRAFSGIIYCVHCGRRLVTRRQYYTARDRMYAYYACMTPKTLGIKCPAGSRGQHCAVRSEVVDRQFGAILGWLGGWSAEALANMKQLYEAVDGDSVDPRLEYERKQAELGRRKANLSRQHEIGLVDDTQLVNRLAEIRTEEAHLQARHAVARPHWGSALETIHAFESLGAQWNEAASAGETGLCHRMAFALVDAIHLDLLQERIVGIQPKPDIFLPIKQKLEGHGWIVKDSSGLLWNDAPMELETKLVRTRIDDVVDALKAGATTLREVAEQTSIDYSHISGYVRRLIREGFVVSERYPPTGHVQLRLRYIGDQMASQPTGSDE